MGLQDRNYRDKDKSPIKNTEKNNTEIKYLLYPLITMIVLWYGADQLLEKTNGITLIPTSIVGEEDKTLGLVSGGVILKTDRQGHFRGTALINNVPMPFMIDTGATRTAIPEKMAIAAGLSLGPSIQTSTAGGEVTDRLTRIDSLKIGNAEIKNLNADVNQYLDEVLIGMNTLKYFQMTQSGDTLTLMANKQLEN